MSAAQVGAAAPQVAGVSEGYRNATLPEPREQRFGVGARNHHAFDAHFVRDVRMERGTLLDPAIVPLHDKKWLPLCTLTANAESWVARLAPGHLSASQ